MSKSFATIAMTALLASPAWGQTFVIDPATSSITIGLSQTGIGGATFVSDTSSITGTFAVSNPGGPTYNGLTHLDTINAATTATMNFVDVGLSVNLTMAPAEFELLGFNAPSGLDLYSGPFGIHGVDDDADGVTDELDEGINPGGFGNLTGGGPIATGDVLTEVLTHVAFNGTGVGGGPFALNQTTWIAPVDGALTPSPFTVSMSPDCFLWTCGGGPDEARIVQNFWVDYGNFVANFNLSFTIIGDGSLTVPADVDDDGDVDGVDFSVFASCFNKAGNPPRTFGCDANAQNALDFDNDGDVDGVDFSTFASCFNKAGNPPRTAGCPQF